MHSKEELCRKITEIFPDIGACGIDVDVAFDERQNAWTVNLRHGDHELKHYLEIDDAGYCLDDRQCVSLGLEIAQLKHNATGQQF